MKKEEHIKKLEYLSFTAAMNVRYHQYKWTRFSNIDKGIRIAVGVVAVISVVVSINGFSMSNNGYFGFASAAIAILSLIVAIVLNITPANEREAFHRDLLRRWSDLREEVDGEIVRVESTVDYENDVYKEERLHRLEDLAKKKNRINSMENSPDDELLQKCYREENKSRSGYATKEEKDLHEKEKNAIKND